MLLPSWLKDFESWSRMPHNLKRDLTSEELRKTKRAIVSVSMLFRHQFPDLAKRFPRPEPQEPLRCSFGMENVEERVLSLCVDEPSALGGAVLHGLRSWGVFSCSLDFIGIHVPCHSSPCCALRGARFRCCIVGLGAAARLRHAVVLLDFVVLKPVELQLFRLSQWGRCLSRSWSLWV